MIDIQNRGESPYRNAAYVDWRPHLEVSVSAHSVVVPSSRPVFTASNRSGTMKYLERAVPMGAPSRSEQRQRRDVTGNASRRNQHFMFDDMVDYQRADLATFVAPRPDLIFEDRTPADGPWTLDADARLVLSNDEAHHISCNDILPSRSRSSAEALSRPRSIWALQGWRLKRVTEHVEMHLTSSLSLPKLASIAGLSRMHFAAQFKAATGMSPHQFVLKRRVERAKAMLTETAEELVGVALSVGFQSQAHFTTVFKRFVGETPHRWRCENRPI